MTSLISCLDIISSANYKYCYLRGKRKNMIHRTILKQTQFIKKMILRLVTSLPGIQCAIVHMFSDMIWKSAYTGMCCKRNENGRSTPERILYYNHRYRCIFSSIITSNDWLNLRISFFNADLYFSSARTPALQRDGSRQKSGFHKPLPSYGVC